MRRRAFLTRIAGALAAIAAAPLLPAVGQKTYWESAPIDLAVGEMRLNPRYLRLLMTTPYGTDWYDTALQESADGRTWRAKIDWPIGIVKFDQHAVIRLTGPIAK